MATFILGILRQIRQIRQLHSMIWRGADVRQRLWLSRNGIIQNRPILRSYYLFLSDL